MIRELASPDPALRDEILALLARVEAHDGVAAVGEVGLLELRFPLHPSTHLVVLEGGALAGYAWTDGTTAELAVAPQWRRRGHGTALLRRVLAEEGVAVWAHGTLPEAVALAERHGLRASRKLWHMVRDPGAAVVPPLPSGLRVRTFRDDDAASWVALNARIFASHPEQGRLTAADLSARRAEPWSDPAGFLLVEHDGALVAYGWLKRTGDEAEVYVLGVAPEHQRHGIAAHLLGRMAELAERGGARALTLHVEGDNLTAIRSYERSGFRHDSTDTQFSPVAAPGEDSDR
ncbi:MAG: mycothiol synthase [Actinomycetota bacterium]